MDVNVTLRQWYEADNPKDLFDVPVAPFEEVLFWDAGEASIPLRELSPYETRLIVLYRMSDDAAFIDIFGTVTFQEAYYKYGGKIPSSALLWKRTISLPPPEDDAPRRPQLFLWPNIFGSMQDIPNCDYEDFCAHMMKLIRIDQEEEEDVPAEPAEPVPCATWLISLVGNLLEQEKKWDLRNAFEHMRLAGEKKLFFANIAPFTQNEELMIELFKHNEQQEWLLEREDGILTSQDEESRRDHVWFFENFPNHKRPSFYWKIPMWQMPQELALSMPLYEGGVLHVPYTCIHLWLWHTFESYAQVGAGRASSRPNPFQMRWIVNAKENFERYWKHYKVKKRVAAPGPRPQANLPLRQFSKVNLKFDQLMKLFPACISRIFFDLHRFPWHSIRTYLTHILVAAGWTKELIEWFFEQWNDACPKNPPETLPQRFSVKSAIEFANKVGIENVHNCGNIISATIKGVEGTITCPYAHSSSGDKRACKEKCCGKGNVRGPHQILHDRLVDIEDIKNFI